MPVSPSQTLGIKMQQLFIPWYPARSPLLVTNPSLLLSNPTQILRGEAPSWRGFDQRCLKPGAACSPSQRIPAPKPRMAPAAFSERLSQR